MISLSYNRGQVGIYVREEMVSRALPFEEFCAMGATLAADERLMVRLGDRYMPWRSAGPLLLSLLAYRRPLPNVSILLITVLLIVVKIYFVLCFLQQIY